MSKIRITGVFIFLVITSLYVLSCQDNINTSLEESVAPYMELQAIDEASNSTITVNRGESQNLDSYFAFDLNNIQDNGIIANGLTEGWCLEWNKPIRQNNDTHSGVEMYNTFDSDTWKPANYLMKIRKELKAADSDLTYREIQVALWSLIESPRFDLDEVLREGNMPSRMMKNGQPNFSVDKVKQIVNRVRNNVSEFEYKPGTPVIVFSKTDDDQQNVGGVFGESAWGVTTTQNNEVDTDWSIEFCKNEWDGKKMPEKWGWSNGVYSNGSSGTLDLYAGAGGCNLSKGDYVGTFTFTYQNGSLDFTVDLEVDNDFKDLHIHAGNSVLPLHNNGKKYLGAPGQFDFDYSISSGIGSFSETIVGLSGDIFISVHLGG